MPSIIVTVTAIESALGAVLTCTILYLVLRNGRRAYHYLFAVFLLICAVWDLGIFLIMIRNTHVNELGTIGYAVALPCTFIPALLFHFACEYTRRRIQWAIAIGWTACAVLLLLGLAGLYWKIEGVHAYTWGNIFRVTPGPLDAWAMVGWFGLNLAACWMLFRSAATARDPLERRHSLYIASGLLVVTFAIVKVGVAMGVDIPLLLPLGMCLVDIFNAIVGVAIVKERLFDITIIIEKGTVYSILAGLLVFVYSLSEHVLITYFGKWFEGYSEAAHLFSIAVGIAILMPVKQRVEHGIARYFAPRKFVF